MYYAIAIAIACLRYEVFLRAKQANKFYPPSSRLSCESHYHLKYIYEHKVYLRT